MSQKQANASFGGESSLSNRKQTTTDEISKEEFPPGKRYNPRPDWKIILWNPKTKEFLCRNAASWARILIFYIIFYLFLAGFFSFMMIVFYSTLSYDRPTYTARGEQSIMSSPGLSRRPNFNHIVAFDSRNNCSEIYSLQSFIQGYNETREKNTLNYKNCSVVTNSDQRRRGKVCDFDLSQLLYLNSSDWGCRNGSPSVILKLNRVFDWKPKLINKTSKALPQDLRDYINGSALTNMVWLWCTANEGTNFTYSPHPGFPAFYYPFHGQVGYLAPLVVVSVNTTGSTDDEIKVTCTAYAENIKMPSLSFIIIKSSS